MSNYALRSQLSQLEGKLRQVEHYNSQLLRELSIVVNGVSRAQGDLEDYNSKLRSILDSCNRTMHSSHQRVVDSVALQKEIERLYVRFKNVELANKKIRAAKNKIYYDFANYRTVRKIVQGIMDNLDLRMVSERTIMKTVEVGHLQTPDYWLTCVLISVLAWRNDDRELADRSMDRALKLAKKESAIFYMLFNLLMARDTAALKWFYTYQECELKGSDQRTFLMLFSLVSKTMTDNVDDRIKNEIYAYIKTVIDANLKAAGYSEEEMVSQIGYFFDRTQPSDQLQYTLLRKHCREFDELTSVMMQAKNNINILEFILRTIHVPIDEKNTFLKEYINEIIAAPNQVEKNVYDEIAYNELIIRLGGQVGLAKEQFADEQERKASDLDLIAEMIDWIYERDSQDVNGQIRLNMFTLTKMLHEKAVKAHAEKYRSRRKSSLQVGIGEYSTLVDFNNEDNEQAKIVAFHTAKRDEGLRAIKDFPAYVGFGIAAAALVGSFFTSFLLLAVSLGGVGYGLFNLLSNKTKRKQLEQTSNEHIRTTGEIMRQLFAEFKEYLKELDEYDAYHSKIMDELSKV